MFDILKIAGIYMGIIIGAGFASGQEILRFFIDYGENWIFGMIFSGVIFSVVGGSAVKIIYNRNIKNSRDFFIEVSGKFLGSLLDLVAVVFTMVLFIAMSSASGAVFSEGFENNRFVGSFVVMFICFVVFCFGSEGVAVVNSILSPLILICGVVVCFYICFFNDVETFMYGIYGVSDYGWIFSAVLYSSYNIITGISAIVSSRDIIIRNKNTYIGGVLGGIGMCLLGILTGTVLFLYGEKSVSSEIPLFDILENSKHIIKNVYFLMVGSAVLSTALGNGYAFIDRMYNSFGIGKNYISGFICLFGVFFANVDFSSFVARLYSFFGFLGVGAVISVIIYILRNY